MKFKLKYADKIVGIFILLAIFVLFSVIILVLINQKTFIKKYYFRSRFSNRIGLSINQDILFKGFKIGKIISYKLNTLPQKMSIEEFEKEILNKILNRKIQKYKKNSPEYQKIIEENNLDKNFVLSQYTIDKKNYIITKELTQENKMKLLKIFNSIEYTNTVDVVLFIYETYIDLIKENSVLSKSTNPLSASTIDFIPNETTDKIAKEYDYIYSLDSEEGKLLVQYGQIKKEADTISNILNNVNDILVNINEITSSINSDRNISDNSIARILVNTADTIESLKKQIDSFDGIISNFYEITDNFKTLSFNMKDPNGLAQRLIDPSGEYMFNSLRNSLDSLANVMDNLDKFSLFISGQSKQIEVLLLETKSTMQQAKDVLEGIRNNPLIKGGISDKKEPQTIKQSIRDKDF